MTNLTQRRFTTKDASGCEFICHAQYTTAWDSKAMDFVTKAVYIADGIGAEATDLSELKRKVASL